MSRRLMVIGLAALLAAPAAAAVGYGVRGEWEPSTKGDLDGYMPTYIDTTPTDAATKVRQVYFNAFAGFTAGYVVSVQTGLNPNVAGPGGAVASGYQAYPWHSFAMLGVWKDCNNDGYIGLAEGAVLEYRVEVLRNTFGESICKPETVNTPPPGQPWPSGFVYPHNDGAWVKEFIPIGWNTGAVSTFTPDFNPTNIGDFGARVWGDWGKPTDPPGGTCYVAPHERGTWHSVGGVTNYADCFASGNIRKTVESNGLGPQYATLQAIQNPWGEESDASYAEMWDCSQPKLVNQHPTGSLWINVSTPRAPPTVNAGGSPSGTMNTTGAGFDECQRSREDKVTNNHPGQILANLPYTTEEPNGVSPYANNPVSNQPTARKEPDWDFRYNEGSRPNPPYSALGRHTPSDVTGTRATDFEGFWQSTSVTAASRNPYLSRGAFEPQKVTYTTHYANVSATAQSLYGLTLSGKTGVYGANVCEAGIGTGKGIQGLAPGWQCDPAAWWKDADGKDTEPKVNIVGFDGKLKQDVKVGVRVGALYQFRDVDCYDASVKPLRDNDISFGTITGTKCE